jgi:hypothetical protein
MASVAAVLTCRSIASDLLVQLVEVKLHSSHCFRPAATLSLVSPNFSSVTFSVRVYAVRIYVLVPCKLSLALGLGFLVPVWPNTCPEERVRTHY